MISLRRVLASDRGVRVGPLDLDLAPALHAVLGSRADGAHLLLSALADRVPYRGTKTLVHPIASVLDGLRLPSELTPLEYLESASTLRGLAREGRATLEHFALSDWANIPIARLSFPEKKALALAEALTSGAPFIALADPLGDLPFASREAVTQGIRGLSSNQTCVFSTEKVGDVLSLGSQVIVLDQGSVRFASTVSDAEGLFSGKRIVVELDDPGLLSSLLHEAAPSSLTLETRGNVLWITPRSNRGAAPETDISSLVTRLVAEHRLEIASMRRETALPEVVRARLRGELRQ